MTATELEAIVSSLRSGADHSERIPGIEAWNTPFVGFRFTARSAREIADILEAASKLSRIVDGGV